MTFTAQWHIVKIDKEASFFLSTMLENCAVRLKNLMMKLKDHDKT